MTITEMRERLEGSTIKSVDLWLTEDKEGDPITIGGIELASGERFTFQGETLFNGAVIYLDD